MNIFIKKLLREGLLVDSELNELINNLDFSSFKINKTLNPNVWLSDTEVKPEIRQTLINIAKKYYESLGLKIPISDIILTGSLANYNWSKYSDFDIHILIDTKKFGEKEELIKDLLDTKTKSWNDSHDIKIKGYDVELYVQGVDQEHHSTGVYSLMNEKWLLKPEKVNPKINKKEVKAKYDKIVNILSDIKKEYDSEKYDLVVDRLGKLKDRIKKMRQAGLEGAGEFSSENIAFKLLRRNNIMGELYDLLISAYDKSVSIDENKTKLYEEDGELKFEINENEDTITITGFINEGDIVGSVILEREFDAYYEFEGEMSEDDFYEIFEDGNFIKIEYIKIEDKYKNKGYGKLLLAKAIDYVKEIGESIIYLNASPMGNTGLALPELVSFYKKFGFKIIPKLDKYKENKEMVLHLNQNINESRDKTIKCGNCGWHWKKSQSKKEDLYLCHKCGYNTAPRNINEGIVKSELVNIDDDDLYDSLEAQADELRSNSEISFGSADPFEILYDDETRKLVGATWIETSGAFSPHMIINPDYRKLGLSQQLIDGVVEKYKKMKQLRGDNYPFMLNVVNNSLADTMEKHYGFKKVSEDPHGNITMTL